MCFVRVRIAIKHKLTQISIFRSFMLLETVSSVEHARHILEPLVIQLMFMGFHVGLTHSFNVTGFSASVNWFILFERITK